jgi:AraC family transcriptional regulator, regulatory protein of adaptative response / methylated-DNA-[protein]-cysteine methyltransferase
MSDYERIANVIRYLDACHIEQPDLALVAKQVGLSTFHFHRLFTRWAGITPKDFIQCLTLRHVKALLQEGQSVLHAALNAGLSGPSRLHDLCVSLEAASPGEIKLRGARWAIEAGFADSPFGTCLVARSPRGICHLPFVDAADRRAGEAAIHQDWPLAQFRWDNAGAALVVAQLFQKPVNSRPALRAYVRGTEFQVHVWRALLQVPAGTLISYGELATAVGNRGAARAVGMAVGRNPLAYLIPCHRVIRETGAVGDYRWGPARKRAMVAWESARGTGIQPTAARLEIH